ncbi:periplasmic immunogenic protein [Halalkalibacter wakoensis JCM 9140]|uniref:Periplasmic immunogenic protein n=1 Tax=Halalkalibacter wakoensis JCM 9140 TaxID=1236970 RepID=W4Q0M3_9BACI|nr:SIMPL domain-containing protein [Halalkalibacter wakoensis]GAE25631.1 periplasmic immunogenic protein [Halalkalibacter wakoensis JCM 9140]
MYNESFIQHQPRNATLSTGLKVMGEGVVTTAPDQAEILLGVITEGASVEDTQQQNATAIARVVQTITSLGIGQEAIQTSTYRVDPQYDFIEGVQVFRGYRVVHLLQVTIAQIELVGTVIDSVVQAGANSIASIHFSVRDLDTYYQRALVQAIEQAKDKARVMSNALGVSLQPIPMQVIEMDKTISNRTSYPTVLSAHTNGTSIQGGELTISAMVQLEYAIQT